MERFDHLIIGGGIAGVTAAETIRASAPTASIAVIGDEPHRLYSRVLLPRYVESKLERERLYLRKEGQLEEKNITFTAGVRVRSVNVSAHQVVMEDGRTLEYGKLLIATGGRVRRLPCSGGNDPDIDHFQTMEDADALKTASGARAAVVGSGFIALELLMAYSRLGLSPTLLLRRNGMFSRALDATSVERVHKELLANGVEVRTGVEVAGIARQGSGFLLSLSDNSEFACERLGVGIGLEPNIEFVAGTGISTGAGILTDSMLATSAPDVYAAGDVAEYPDPIAGRHRLVGNWQNALFQGKLAALNMLGGNDVFDQVTAYTISCFGLPLAFVGAVDGTFETRAVQISEKSILQLCVAQNRVIGASNVGQFPTRAAVVEIIKRGVTIDERALRRFEAGEDISTAFPQ